jgi:GntR family transcriptional regulator
MIELDLASLVPLNEQIKSGLRGLVARGLLKPGDQAPSVRSLAERLKVNPNTVARAFRELAQEGFFEPRRGDGSYVSEQAAKPVEEGLEAARARLLEAVRQARRGGVSWSDVEKLVRKARESEK